MASMIKCKECSAEISKKAKKCPKCGAPQGPKQYSLGKLLVVILFSVFMYSIFFSNSSEVSNTNQINLSPASQAKTELVIDVLSVAGKTKSEVVSILGSPKSCSPIKYGDRCEYLKFETEIVFINNKADWITIHQLDAVPYREDALASIGLQQSPPSFSNSNVMRWQNKNGLLEISLFPTGDNYVEYVYIKARTR